MVSFMSIRLLSKKVRRGVSSASLTWVSDLSPLNHTVVITTCVTNYIHNKMLSNFFLYNYTESPKVFYSLLTFYHHQRPLFPTQGQTAFDVADEDILGYLEELQKKQNLVCLMTV